VFRRAAPPLADRKKLLARLVGKRRIGIVLSEHADGGPCQILEETGTKITSQAQRPPVNFSQLPELPFYKHKDSGPT
jgi:hypothetical protein